MARTQNVRDTSVSVEHETQRYDVAISYATEDRAHAEELACHLRARGCRVFIDTLEPLELWGADVGRRLEEIFDRDARMVVILASRHWASRRWTMHERNAIRSRASREARSVLPITMGIRQVLGLPDVHGHLDISLGLDALGTLILRALEELSMAALPAMSTFPATAAPREDEMPRAPHFHPILQTTVQPSQSGNNNKQKTSTKVTTGISSFGLVSVLMLVVTSIVGMGWLALDFVRNQPRNSEGRVEVLGIPVPELIVGQSPDDVAPEETTEELTPKEASIEEGPGEAEVVAPPQPAGSITRERLAGAWRCPRQSIGQFETTAATVMFTESGRVSIAPQYSQHKFQPPFSLWNDAPYTITSPQSVKVEDHEVIVNMDKGHDAMHITGGRYTFKCTRVNLDEETPE